MRILFLGDVVAKSGREAVIHNIYSIQQANKIDFTIVNAENSAHGKGITEKIYMKLIESGVDIVTLGNHAFSKKEIVEALDRCEFMTRPANLNPLSGGSSMVIRECMGKRIAVINLLGCVFMPMSTDDPLKVMNEMLEHEIDADIIIVDLHGEATSEKILFAEYFAKSLTAVIGTHTHVQTADERIIDGCAFITDVGMCGPWRSVLGRDLDEVIANYVEGEPTHYAPATGPSVICGCIIETDDQTNRAVNIKRLQIRPD
jgi:metallophosphoesterase (TIGR00282 family)